MVSPPAQSIASPRPQVSQVFIDGFKRERCAAALAGAVREQGWHKTTVSDVCRAAAISRTTFYDLFDGLPDAAAYTAAWARRFLLEPLEAAAGGGGTWKARLEAGLAGFAEQLDKQPAVAEYCLVHAVAAAERTDGPYDPAVTRALASLLSPGLPSPAIAELWAYGIVSLAARRLIGGGGTGFPLPLNGPAGPMCFTPQVG